MSQAHTPLSLKEKICYGIGDVANGLAVSSVALWFLKYLTDVAGLQAVYAGLAIAIGRVWDAVTDPLMGWIADHTDTRWGKRRPYLLFGALPYALAFFSLWIVPEFTDQVHLFAYVTVTLILFNTFLTVVFVPYTSLTAAITNDYNERTSLTGYRMTLSQTAMLIGSALPATIVAWSISDSGQHHLARVGLDVFFGDWFGSARSGYTIMAAAFALIMIVSILTSFKGTREKDTRLEKADVVTPFSYASSIVSQLANNHPYRSSVLILLLTNLAASSIAVNLPYYLEYALHIKAKQSILIATLFVMATVSVPVWAMVTKKYGKAETYRMAMGVYAVVVASLALIPAGHLFLLFALAAVAGCLHGAALMIPWAMVPDVVEHDELKTGKRREGLFYGGTTFSYKMATALGVIASSFVLELVGYAPNEAQTDLTVTSMRLLVGPFPALVILIAAYIALRHPLNRAKHEKILEALEERRQQIRMAAGD